MIFRSAAIELPAVAFHPLTGIPAQSFIRLLLFLFLLLLLLLHLLLRLRPPERLYMYIYVGEPAPATPPYSCARPPVPRSLRTARLRASLSRPRSPGGTRRAPNRKNGFASRVIRSFKRTNSENKNTRTRVAKRLDIFFVPGEVSARALLIYKRVWRTRIP